MMKVEISKVKAHVNVHFELSGSVLAGTIRARVPKVETRYEVESPEDDSKVVRMLTNARNGCWVRAAVSNPVPFEDVVYLNGKSFDLGPLSE